MSRLEFWQRAYLIALEASLALESGTVLAGGCARAAAKQAVEDLHAEFGRQSEETVLAYGRQSWESKG